MRRACPLLGEVEEVVARSEQAATAGSLSPVRGGSRGEDREFVIDHGSSRVPSVMTGMKAFCFSSYAYRPSIGPVERLFGDCPGRASRRPWRTR